MDGARVLKMEVVGKPGWKPKNKVKRTRLLKGLSYEIDFENVDENL